ncbi:MAG TPA: rhodanese-like domain-containing protein [Candidatus Dormibacteraeota bacterium]|nr:rhodanese-like domain-containing protein [Candidatus Dormibacteraeota bacterium]
MATLIDRDRLRQMVDAGAQLIEVLPPKEYAEDHLPGAVSHPLRQLEKDSGQIDPNRQIIVYCWDAA